MTEHDHHSPSEPEPAGSADPYAAPSASPGAPAAPWSTPAACGTPTLAGPQGAGYATPYGADAERAPAPGTTNPWSVVALVTGILFLVPVAIGSGIAALVQINRHKQAGKGMAIAGLVMATAWTLTGAGFGVYIATKSLVWPTGTATGAATDTAPETPSDRILGRIADAGSTTVGDCLRDSTAQDSISTKIPCSTLHFAEVYRTLDVAGSRWPGFDNIAQRANDLCRAQFRGYVGTSYESSDFDYDYYLPDQGEWTAGEHRAVCVLLPADTDTVRGTGHNSHR